MSSILNYLMVTFGISPHELAGIANLVIISGALVVFFWVIISQELQFRVDDKLGYFRVRKACTRWSTPEAMQGYFTIAVGCITTLAGLYVASWYAGIVDKTINELIRWPW